MSRARILKGAGALGAAALGAGYVQRLPKKEDHHLAWSQSMSTRLYSDFALPWILQTDPETAHLLTLRCGELVQALHAMLPSTVPMQWLLNPGVAAPQGPSLQQRLMGLAFDSPVGIAAGFDKNALLVPLYRSGFLGLGFAEIGSVSARAAAGNAKPRCWRIPSDDVVINAMGLNNDGAEAIAEKLKSLKVEGGHRGRPVGVNIAKTHDPAILGPAAVEDFAMSFRLLAPLADFVVLNVSCPNTTEGKTFEEPAALAELLGAVGRTRQALGKEVEKVPVLVKLMATADDQAGRQTQRELLKVIEESNFVQGLVISNTIKNPEAKLSKKGREEANAIGKGGVSGRVIHKRSVAAIRSAYQATGGRLTIIGVGGTDSAEAAYEKIRAGASLVEVYTGLVYKGPGLLEDLQTGLQRLLERDGFDSLQQAIGIDSK